MSDALIDYRLKQAEDSRAEAEVLLSAGKSFRGAVNRAYYAMFYAVLALQVRTGKAGSKHSGITALFDEHFVKPGILDKALSKSLHKAFDLRQDSD